MPPPTKGGKRSITGGSGKGKGKGKGKKATSAQGKGKAGAPNKSGSIGGPKKRSRKSRGSGWKTYIHRTHKQVYNQITLSKSTMGVLTSFVEDMFQKLLSEAVHIAKINNTKTLSAREIQTSARLLLPPELAKHAMSEGTKAVAKYNAGTDKDATQN
jgi:histone H2B